jgi:hypothetical protein
MLKVLMYFMRMITSTVIILSFFMNADTANFCFKISGLGHKWSQSDFTCRNIFKALQEVIG